MLIHFKILNGLTPCDIPSDWVYTSPDVCRNKSTPDCFFIPLSSCQVSRELEREWFELPCLLCPYAYFIFPNLSLVAGRCAGWSVVSRLQHCLEGVGKPAIRIPRPGQRREAAGKGAKLHSAHPRLAQADGSMVAIANNEVCTRCIRGARRERNSPSAYVPVGILYDLFPLCSHGPRPTSRKICRGDNGM